MTQGRAVPVELRAEAVAAYEAGYSPIEVGSVLGVSGRTVLNWVREAGKPIRPAGNRSDQSKAAEVVDLYLSGMSASQVAARLSVSPMTVADWVRAAGHEMRPSGKRADIVDAPYDSHVSTSLTVADRARVDKIVAADGLSLADVIRRAVVEYLDRRGV